MRISKGNILKFDGQWVRKRSTCTTFLSLSVFHLHIVSQVSQLQTCLSQITVVFHQSCKPGGKSGDHPYIKGKFRHAECMIEYLSNQNPIGKQITNNQKEVVGNIHQLHPAPDVRAELFDFLV